MSRKQWTMKEVDQLQDKWGTVSIKGIAKLLGRNVSSVRQKANHLGLTDARLNFDGITVCQLMQALDKSYSTVYPWIKKYGMPVREKLFCEEMRVKVITYDDFWKWAKKNKELLNLAKLEENLLGPEPSWAKEKRKADIQRSQRTWQSTAWEAKEDQRLLQLVKNTNVTYPELAKQLNRTESSIRRRLYDLNIKHRPVRLNNHVKYTLEQTSLLMDMARAGYGYETIAQALGPDKSANGVRGKLERMDFDFKRREFRDPKKLSM